MCIQPREGCLAAERCSLCECEQVATHRLINYPQGWNEDNATSFLALIMTGYMEEKPVSSKHPKQTKPSDADLHENPMIGGSKGTTMAQVSRDELEQFEGVNTIEGDIENDTNRFGGLDKAEVRNARSGRPDHGRDPGPRPALGSHLEKSQAKGAGSGGMTNLQDELVGENDVLSNRDKVKQSGERGQDGKWVQTEKLEDHAANKGRG